ncbi:MAG: GntR family transcriptional regulator [Brevibacterium sp.]|uniref:GntR family transcriptional regulator n=1 Tax=Brevibacterium sp. TaxID=1701 RepID=UPI002648D211|nr:GntR family transcriptional regulator [Brevibacterium sp.]MDN5807235.1 GntR family transcriptional regulator [Brevibacterium sp.]MDN5834625.1 GntR family transcriptional regulator [Brevibacterium sp.]MDN5876370.1 GntR family transcriptional regulator [Brevibacterium sp.]MDN5909354.1 GntR family transcriptional regulator [Brevibacterium sp.]MDN6134480.1 GntR family transcriptional regulator [Brevibacterium sp.]
MNELLTLPWESTDDTSPIASRMAAWAAREIIEQRYEPGQLLTEADLAEAQKASRTPAREAMLQLERWRLVRLVPKKGAIVTTVTSQERRDLLAMRAMFEIDAVQTLTADSSLSQVAADLRSLLDMQQEARKAGRSLDFASADYAFHARIIRSGGNSVVGETLSTIGPRLARLTYQVIIDQPDSLDTLLDEHAELTGLAERGDVKEFATLVHRHITASHFPQGNK